MNSHVWVEVSINIGKKNLKIQIQRNQCIQDVVSSFISTNKLSTKYQPIITNMIKQQIKIRMDHQQNEVKIQDQINNNNKSHTNSIVSSTSTLSQQISDQSGVFNKNSGIMSQIMRIQEETNRKRNQKLAQLRQSSISKNVAYTNQKSQLQIQRPSIKKVEAFNSRSDALQSTPKMVVDTSRQSSTQTFNYKSEQSCKHLISEPSHNNLNEQSNNFSQQNIVAETGRSRSRVITEDVAELKQLLSYNQQYNSNRQFQQSGIWNDTKKSNNHSSSRQMNSKRLKTQTPQNIYEKWKRLQQKKRVDSNNKIQQISKIKPKSKSPLVKRQDNFFYNKGKSFLDQKNKKIQTKFNQIYPFKTSKTPINSKTGVQTSNRLFKQSKQYFSKKMVKPRHVDLDLSLKPDPIRQKVRKRDEQHDEILSQLIKQGRIKSPVTLKYKDKSPFRKTIVFN